MDAVFKRGEAGAIRRAITRRFAAHLMSPFERHRAPRYTASPAKSSGAFGTLDIPKILPTA
jgi:hypothetical protein